MGGETDTDWDMHPDRDLILIGTQDQLISRALNRGYGMSRFRWPVHFGLLNNDCLWVFDEVQLMGAGLTTSVQLDAFRKMLGTILPVKSTWMSATLQKNWLSTVDFDPSLHITDEITLSDADLNDPSLRNRFQAKKPVSKVGINHSDLNSLADVVLKEHRPGTKTLVIVNTVKRAIALYDEVKRKRQAADLVLIHSRFRPGDRLKSLSALLAPPPANGTICISTQVVEAGVDVSATTLITDLAPWASLVQRFGRCNRAGTDSSARVFWIEPDFDKKGASLPYSNEELSVSASLLREISNAAPQDLPESQGDFKHLHVLRKKDMIDLFDTTPDLAGADIDISRFIRETDDHDIQVFWRDLPKEGPGATEPAPSREELCSVSIGDLPTDIDIWRWDHLEEEWVRARNIFPGLVLMLRKEAGCYSPEKGWTGNRKDIPRPVDKPELPEEANDDDFYSKGIWQTLPDHSDAVLLELLEILERCPIPDRRWAECLSISARWHDVGKAHPVAQQAMRGDPPEADESVIWAKTARGNIRYSRRGFRHELASALAMIEYGLPDLAAYLAASHHGKVRLSIRSLPTETKPPDPNTRFARGIWDKDLLPAVDLGDGVSLAQTELDLSLMEFGEGTRGPSWLARMLALRDAEDLGLFRLALLEALLRVADWRASRKAVLNGA
ncbi:MAG TPA: CRISPR-associated helicase Cas3', partial [Syntrophobacteraceae bacterium]|nr:CRISPR-associated helicase Cas3' [Syntrophobacteraceae bacterium]